MVSCSSLMCHGNVDDSHIPSFSFNQYSREKGGSWNQSWRFYQLPTTKIVSLFLSWSFPARMDHTRNQPTLVHAKFLVSLFKKGIELAGEMPETGEILMILLENHQPIESIWNFLVNIFLFRLSISIPSFSLDMAGQTWWNPRHWGIIIPAETIEICVRMKMVYNPQLLPFI